METIIQKCILLEHLVKKAETFKYVTMNLDDIKLKNILMMRWFIKNFIPNESGNVLIIGFSPGITTLLCAIEFPNIMFHIFDYQPYIKSLDNQNNVIVFNKSFTERDALIYSKMENLVLYYVLKTKNNSNLNEEIEYQQKIVRLVNADYSMIKYKLSENNTILPVGYKIIQPFSKHTYETAIIQEKNKQWFVSNDLYYTINFKSKLNSYNALRDKDGNIDIRIVQKMFKISYKKAEQMIEKYRNGISFFHGIYNDEKFTNLKRQNNNINYTYKEELNGDDHDLKNSLL